ncbi:NAD(P)-dependent oxidoreductase [Oceanobacillus profundus]|uniref:NAD(P)-dependent oxidoreductase n=1 Tax=Oceanobacillus profundus TaxID=372463 RepID=UPI00204258E7|nr:NAD(P)-dependent oxidoreductase [Oceanobacillus profundus]MCM3397965.1 NAD(P)-dependent oxidoreductase [Oceanobacillus profundus]
MNIAVIGASGKAGKLILKEAMDRGHQVAAIVREATKLADKNVAIIEKDIFDLNREDLNRFDVIVNAFGAPLGEEQAHVDAGHHLIKLLQETNTRLIVVGGAGSLYADESKTIRIIDTPDFPDVFKPTANGQGRNLKELQETDQLAWTFVSPSAIFDAEGERTGSYKSGKDVLLVNAAGQSYISYADFAIAIVDEMEDAKHINERFTVVSE